MRERILAAAKSGELKKLVTAMQTNETMPIFSLGDDKDPAAFWKKTYPDSDGLEVLAILLGILEAPLCACRERHARRKCICGPISRACR